MFERPPEKRSLYMRVPFDYGKSYLREVDAEYLITSSGCYGRYIDPPSPPRTPSNADFYRIRDTYSALLFDAETHGWRLRKRFDEGKGPEILLFERINISDSPQSTE
jgi:hypothetical protein